MSVDAELYRTLVEASADGLWLLDDEGRTLLYNPRMAELLGRTPEQMEGLSAFDVHDEPGQGRVRPSPAEARAGHPGHFDKEAKYLKPDGTPVWVLVSFRPVRDAGGHVPGFLHQYSDYTEAHGLIDQLAHREQQLATAQHIAKMGSWEWDIVRDESVWSDELYKLYGIDPEQLRGRLRGLPGADPPRGPTPGAGGARGDVRRRRLLHLAGPGRAARRRGALVPVPRPGGARRLRYADPADRRRPGHHRRR